MFKFVEDEGSLPSLKSVLGDKCIVVFKE